MSKPYKTATLEQAKRFIGLKSTSYKDYLAARHLLNDNFLHQSAFFINTCIEKEIKAYLFSIGIDVNINHDTFKLLTLLRQHKPLIADKLNPEFLKAISKIYESRYYEKLGAGYNFVILKNKFLSELDYSYSILEPTLRYKLNREPEMPKTQYEIDKESKNPVLYRNNYLLNGLDKSEFLNQVDYAYEFRVVYNHEIIEAYYPTPGDKQHNKFLYEGLVPLPNNKSFKTSNPPLPM